MRRFIVHDKQGKILRTGVCPAQDFVHQAKEGEFVLEGTANDAIQKIVNNKVVNKTPKEIERDNLTPMPVPFEKRSAHITNEQWQDVLNRLNQLDIRLAKIGE